MGIVAGNYSKLQYQSVTILLMYAKQVLDKNNTEIIKIENATTDPIFKYLTEGYLAYLLPVGRNLNNTDILKKILEQEVKNISNSSLISIDKHLKPLLVKAYENAISNNNQSKCNNPLGCSKWFRSEPELDPNLSITGNVSSNTGLLILNGENDISTRVQRAFIIQQRLTEVNHRDHSLITYPNLRHYFYPSTEGMPGNGPIPQYVLADLYAWLEFHNDMSKSFLKSNSTTNTN